MKQISRRILLASPLAAAGAWTRLFAAAGPEFRLPLRSRVEAFRGSGIWHEVRFEKPFRTSQTAVILCDVWDSHPCRGALERVNLMVRRMAPFVEEVRAQGIQVIHAPSETMTFYKDTPQRRRMVEAPPITPVKNLTDLTDPPLPIDDSDGGCDTEGERLPRWSRQHPAIRIAPEDGISDNGTEVYNFLRLRGIQNLLVMGVHTNMCILNRTFAIRQMTRWGVPCVLIRDLTDAMYDPKDPPYVSHDEGTELVIRHIEKYWCPTALSTEILASLRKVS
jgi:nicotinamidase-related amidase